MKEALSPDAVANTIRMLRTNNPTLAMCIVEGGDDLRMFRAMTHPTKCSIRVANGWENAVAALKILEGEGARGVIAVIDADLRRFEGLMPGSPNLFWSDFHDLEIDLIHSDAFERVVGEVCDYEQTPHPPPSEMRGRLLRAASPLAYLRLHSYRAGLNLIFSGLTYSEFVDKDSLEVDNKAMVKAVKNKSQRHDLKDEALLNELKKMQNPAHDLRHICRGHDVTEIFSLSLRKIFSNQKPADIPASRLESLLRAAYQIVDFAKTALYAALRIWEVVNPPFLVLA